MMAPEGPVYQAGTLSGNPLAVAAGLATLQVLDREDPYPRLEALAARLEQGIRAHAVAAGIRHVYTRVGSMACLFFNEGPVTDFESACASDTERFGRYFRVMQDEGIYLPPSQFETFFVSAAHDEETIDRVVEASGKALGRLDG
jgi:glutamate-1-semialdehyde 2,1-aminomutase